MNDSALEKTALVSNVHGDNNVTISFPGTLRDWFAGQALIGICSLGINSSETDADADAAYALADAMLAARVAK